MPLHELVSFVSGFVQCVKVLSLDFMSVEEALDLLEVFDTSRLNGILTSIRVHIGDEAFEEVFHGPKNTAFGTTFWPWKGPAMRVDFLETAVVRIPFCVL